MTIAYGTSEHGYEFPVYGGKLLSWDVANVATRQDAQEGYPRTRTVIRAMQEKRPDRLAFERRDLLKSSFDRMFGQNARRLLKLIEEETNS